VTERSAELRYGRIVWAEMKDHRGFRKRRPGIVITPTPQIRDDAPFVVVCVTTRFRNPPPPNHVSLPWNNDPRRVPTRLAQRSAAVIDWLETLYPDEILEVKGYVPTTVMAEIQHRLQRSLESES
jgi:mRNA-degrading endonuclease toxin of MazEF toxin-antitoxin module